VKQLPNFLLASPVLSIAVYSVVHYTKILHQLLQSTRIHKFIVTAIEERTQGHPNVKQRRSAPTEMPSASLDDARSDSQNLKGDLSKCSILLLPLFCILRS
jgi:GPI mannosyltransferase 2